MIGLRHGNPRLHESSNTSLLKGVEKQLRIASESSGSAFGLSSISNEHLKAKTTLVKAAGSSQDEETGQLSGSDMVKGD